MPIRLILITDPSSQSEIDEIWKSSMPPFPLYNSINPGLIVPRFQKIFIDVNTLEKQIEPWSLGLKTYFNNAGSKHTIKSEKLNKFFVVTKFK